MVEQTTFSAADPKDKVPLETKAREMLPDAGRPLVLTTHSSAPLVHPPKLRLEIETGRGCPDSAVVAPLRLDEVQLISLRLVTILNWLVVASIAVFAL